MRDKNSRDAIAWASFFSSPDQAEFEKERVCSVTDRDYHRDRLVFDVCDQHTVGIDLDIDGNREALTSACERVTLKFCIFDTDLAENLLSREDYEKARTLYLRKQWNARLLRTLLAKFCFICNGFSPQSRLADILLIGIRDTYLEIREEQASEKFHKLRKEIDRIASGVCAECYYKAEDVYPEYLYPKKIIPDEAIPDEASRKYLLDVYGYVWRGSPHDSRYWFLLKDGKYIKDLNPLLCTALLDDDAFWKQHPRFYVFAFLESVRNCNDARHAEKILDHIMQFLKSLPNGAMIIEKNLPICFADREALLRLLESRIRQLDLLRFEGKPHYEDLTGPFCFPFSPVPDAEEKIREGEAVFLDFLCSYVYPKNREEVLSYYRNDLFKPHTMHRQTNRRGEPIRYSLADMLDSILCDASWTPCDREAILAYCPSYFDEEQIRNRVYLEVCAIHRAFPEDCVCPYLFERFYSAFQIIEEELDIQTALQLDTASRDEAFQKLCDRLQSYGIHPTEAFRSDYIVSLLDRKVAQFQEKQRFPVLEQLGDSLYNLAVHELLFYQPDCSKQTCFKDRQDAVCAAFQAKVSNCLGLRELYLSTALHRGKYGEDDGLSPDSHSMTLFHAYDGSENCLADSLEMIIGTIALENGIETALSFAKKLIRQTSPDRFPKEVRYSLEALRRPDIDRAYFARILPAPYSKETDVMQNMLESAFQKAMLCCALGTEDLKTRNYITSHLSQALPGEDIESGTISPVFAWYLQNGIASALDAFGEDIRSRYRADCEKKEEGAGHA